MRWFKTFVSSFLLHITVSLANSNHYVVVFVGDINNDTRLASTGLQIVRQLKGEVFEHHYLLAHHTDSSQPLHFAAYTGLNESLNIALANHPKIPWFAQQELKDVSSRSLSVEEFVTYSTKLSNPNFKNQWHLFNSIHQGSDINILPVWAAGFTGKNVTVAVVDDGLEYKNEDIYANYDPDCSFDFVSNKKDPSPSYTDKDGKIIYKNAHGTRCAGEIAAVDNNKCSVGIAYECKLCGLRILGGPSTAQAHTDTMQAEALGFKPQNVDIYSNSYGPPDNGKVYDGPGLLLKKALEYGAKEGRNKKGSIFVFAAGNGGLKDNCNADGYVNSIYTIPISSVTEIMETPSYTEPCSVTFATTFSGKGPNNNRNARPIYTTDGTGGDLRGCLTPREWRKHTGTSASAPIAAGIIATMLNANSHLTYRDVKHILARESGTIPGHVPDINSAGFTLYKNHGFGFMDAQRLVKAALKWSTVPPQHVMRFEPVDISEDVQDEKEILLDVPYNMHLEYIQVAVNFSSIHRRGSLSLALRHPLGMVSELMSPRPDDKKKGTFAWTFASVRHWGESAKGVWKLTVATPEGKSRLESVSMTVYGTLQHPTNHSLLYDTPGNAFGTRNSWRNHAQENTARRVSPRSILLLLSLPIWSQFLLMRD